MRRNYALLGCSSPGQAGFELVLPIYGFLGDCYVSDAENEFITGFSEYDGPLYLIKNSLISRVGDWQLYMFVYDGQVFIGNRWVIAKQLEGFLALTDEQFHPLWKYNIAFFLRDEKMVDDILKHYVSSKYNTDRLTLNSFARPSQLS